MCATYLFFGRGGGLYREGAGGIFCVRAGIRPTLFHDRFSADQISQVAFVMEAWQPVLANGATLPSESAIGVPGAERPSRLWLRGELGGSGVRDWRVGSVSVLNWWRKWARALLKKKR